MRRIALAACLVASLGTVAGCTGSGASLTHASGRQVVVNSDRAFRTVRCENTAEGIRADIGSRSFFVKPTQVEVDGSQVAAIPAGAQVVAVAEFEGRLVVEADRARVYDAEF
jgi:hypothetical protein